MDVAEAIDAESIPVAYRTPGTSGYDDTGRGVRVLGSTVPIMACVQPINGNQLRDLKEGVREEAKLVIWSRVAVQLDGQIDFDAERYRIIHLWERRGDGFTRAALGKLK